MQIRSHWVPAFTGTTVFNGCCNICRPGENRGPVSFARLFNYFTIWASSPFLYFSATFSSAIGLILPAWPSQPNDR
ncbi:MAG: hypothetical protein RL404_225 [Pseudomonadota bacterium]